MGIRVHSRRKSGNCLITRQLGIEVRQINEAGLELIRRFEGLRTERYIDVAGFEAIGYGHRIQEGECIPSTITEAEAEAFLLWDTALAALIVSKFTTVTLTDNQFSALACFAFSVGPLQFEMSTLLKKLNSGYYRAAALEFTRYDRAGGRFLSELTKRRIAERELFLKPDGDKK